MVIFFSLILLAAATAASSEYLCKDNEVLCGDESKCISTNNICDYVYDCEDQSDEDLGLCKKKNTLRGDCQANQIQCRYNYGCTDLNTACTNQNNCNFHTPTILQEFCTVTLPRKLIPLYDNCPSRNKSIELMGHLASAFNQTTDVASNNSCPPLYNRIGNHCISLFTPAEIAWPEAKIFCESISGQLMIINNLANYHKLLTYIKKNQIKERFWIGGFNDLEKSKHSWMWLDGSNIEMGAPFWSVYQNRSCIVGAKPEECLTFYDLMPKSKREANCVALNHDYFYYFSNENCRSRRSPICLYIQA